jgi:DNA-binding transcriptional LysR family regulator
VVDLNEMAVFARVVREGSFTRAARALGLPKSTVSHRIARLEARLGATLLHRTTRSVRCTDAGLAYHERCARIVAEAEEADAAASERHHAARGRVRLCVPHLFGQVFLPAVLSRYLRSFPEIDVEVLFRDGPVDLVGEGFDLAVRVGRAVERDLVARPLGAAEHVLCASPGYARERGMPRSPGDLRRYDCILYGGLPAFPGAWTFERGSRTERVRPRGRLTVGSVLVARSAALDGLGIASLPRFLCAEDLRRRRLLPVLEEWSTIRVPVRVVYPTRRLQPGRVRSLVDLMVALFSATPAWRAAPAPEAWARAPGRGPPPRPA